MVNSENFIIPKKINVGYQERSDCYTKKLGFITYIDSSTGILKKEKSWNSWRDHKIKDDEFENVPMEGFIVNRSVGGGKVGWNYRQAYCRIWDPRGFEIEIGIDNFLWILDYCDSLAGKKIIGKCVYSWIGTELVLLPINTEEYRISSEIMKKREVITKDLKPAELKPGSLYKLKKLPWKYSGISKNYEERKAIFIGEAKFGKELGKKYETKLLFYDPGSIEKEDFVFTESIKSVEFEVCPRVLSDGEIKEIMDRFEMTAYSWKFWNSPIGFIEEFYRQDSALESRLKNDHEAAEKKCHVYIDDLGKTINFYKSYIQYYNDNSGYTYSSYIRTKNISDKYLSYKFDFSGGNIKVSEKILDLGKIFNEYWNYYGFRTVPLNKTVYPEATEEDWINLGENLKNSEEIPKTYIFYKTISGYYSESLQKVLSQEAITSGKSLVRSDLIIYLPIKK